jgi:HSP20 family protein
MANLVRRSPRDWFNLFDRLIESVFEPLDWREENWRGWSPPMEVAETENAYIVRLEVPGVRPEDIEVTLSGDTLTIKGKRERSEEQKGETYHLIERAYGEFVRSFTLPSAVDPEGISADYKDGVLELRLPKTQKELPRRIPINRTLPNNP